MWLLPLLLQLSLKRAEIVTSSPSSAAVILLKTGKCLFAGKTENREVPILPPPVGCGRNESAYLSASQDTSELDHMVMTNDHIHFMSSHAMQARLPSTLLRLAGT